MPTVYLWLQKSFLISYNMHILLNKTRCNSHLSKKLSYELYTEKIVDNELSNYLTYEKLIIDS